MTNDQPAASDGPPPGGNGEEIVVPSPNFSPDLRFIPKVCPFVVPIFTEFYFLEDGVRRTSKSEGLERHGSTPVTPARTF